ncbi:MAG: peptidoglycan-binding protein, partial [Actinomycetota bacterium]|nr:peptidoglycan-binding protein [Actinomycetota bacterium]
MLKAWGPCTGQIQSAELTAGAGAGARVVAGGVAGRGGAVGAGDGSPFEGDGPVEADVVAVAAAGAA